MVRGADYDNGIPQSDNPIENGPNKAHGVGATVRSFLSIATIAILMVDITLTN